MKTDPHEDLKLAALVGARCRVSPGAGFIDRMEFATIEEAFIVDTPGDLFEVADVRFDDGRYDEFPLDWLEVYE